MYDFFSDFENLGIKKGDTVLMHSSMKALKTDISPQEFLQILCDYLGDRGTLVLPTLSYDFVTKENNVFILNETPACIGLLPNVFLKMDGVIRSLHPTHSCAARGFKADEITRDHYLDNTPVGPNSPFMKLANMGGKILMLGDVNNHNTFMHGIEEIAGVPYCLTNDKYEFILFDKYGKKTVVNQYRHDFKNIGQAYERVVDLLPKTGVSFGKIGAANCTLMDAKAVKETALKKFKEDIFYFVNKGC